MDPNIQDVIKLIIGRPCCRKQVGSMRSLSLGFGNKVPQSNPRVKTTFYGEWELGTYNGAWRISCQGKISCASNDPVESIGELDSALNDIQLGSVIAIGHLTSFDVRVELEPGIFIDFLAATSDDDECFHIFCPNDMYVEFSTQRGWSLGKSNKPWGGPAESALD